MNILSFFSSLKSQHTASRTTIPCPHSNDVYSSNASYLPPFPTDGKTARLMALVGQAIETWAAEYHLENMPKKIVFQQAFDAMRTIELLSENSPK